MASHFRANFMLCAKEGSQTPGRRQQNIITSQPLQRYPSAHEVTKLQSSSSFVSILDNQAGLVRSAVVSKYGGFRFGTNVTVIKQVELFCSELFVPKTDPNAENICGFHSLDHWQQLPIQDRLYMFEDWLLVLVVILKLWRHGILPSIRFGLVGLMLSK